MEPLKIERSHFGLNSFVPSEKYLSYFEDHFSVIDEESIKGLQIIENRTKELREREKRNKETIKKLRKILDEQIRKFQELEKVSNLALQEKSREVEELSIENTQLKEERVEWEVLKEEKEALTHKFEQLEKENVNLSEEVAASKQKYNELKAELDQKSELLQNGIQQSQIETEEQGSNFVPGSMHEMEQINSVLEEQIKEQIEEAIKKEEEKLKSNTLEINAILSAFLQTVESEEKQKSQKLENINESIAEGDKLNQLTEELKRKSDEISRVIINSHQLWRDLRSRETEILRLSLNLKDNEKNIQQKDQEIETLKSEMQFNSEKEKAKTKTEEINKEKKSINYEQFEQNLIELIKAKTLEQYKDFYDLIISTLSQIFNTFKTSHKEIDETSEIFIERVMKIIDANLIALNDFFKENLENQNEKIHKMTQFMARAKMMTEKRNEEDEHSDIEEKITLAESTPDRFNSKPVYQHQRNESESSAKSEKKRSILLDVDMDSAVNYDEYMDQLKEDALQEELTDLKNSQVILDSLKEGGEHEENSVHDGLSDSISKSQVSNLSQAEQIRGHNERKKTTLLNAKLKKKKKH